MSRRVWYARDCWLTADPKVEHLADLHGPAGILAYEEVLALAKLANNGGGVSILYSQLARRAYLKGPTLARNIVSACADCGLVELVRADDRGAVVKLPRFARWQVKDPTAADRQAAKRERGEADESR